jgi:hypothetical protein
VNKSIQHNRQIDITIVIDMGVEPIKEENRDMMVDMEKGKLPPLFANDYKNSIPEIPHFGDVKEPEEIGKGRIVLVVSDARKGRVVVAIRQKDGFNGHVGAQHDL